MRREIRGTWKIRDKIKNGTSDSEIRRKSVENKRDFSLETIAEVAVVPNSL